MDALTKKHCKPCEGGVPPLKDEEVRKLLSELKAWELKEEGKAIVRHFQFSDYYKTMAFVNAIAWMAHQEDHHPDLEVSYNFCRVRYTTHAIGGLSENDFICAAKVDALLQLN
jgi:4a-hydroxytetrahydrobiopterin dehydratase